MTTAVSRPTSPVPQETVTIGGPADELHEELQSPVETINRRSGFSYFGTQAMEYVHKGATGIINTVHNIAVEAVMPTISSAVQFGMEKANWAFKQVQVGVESMDVLNMTLKTFNSSMKILRQVGTPTATKVHTDLHAANEVASNATKILSIPSTFRKVTEITRIVNGEGKDNKIGNMPNYLKLTSQVALFASDVIAHLRTLVDVKLASAKLLYKDIFRFESFGYTPGLSLDKLQPVLSVTGFSFGLAENVRKIAKAGQVQLSNGLGALGNVAKLTSVISANLRYPGMPIVSAAANIAGNVIGIANHYVKLNEK